MKLIPLLIALSVFVSGAFADTVEPNRDDVIRLLQKIATESPIRAELEALGYQGKNLELAIKQRLVFVRDPEIAGYMADLLIAANKGQIPENAGSGGLVQGLVDRGISHLSLREMRHLYMVEQSVLKAYSPRDCGRTIKGRPQSEHQYQVAARLEAQMPTVALREYYRIQLKAARLGLHHEAKTLSPKRQAELTKKIFEKLRERVADSKDARGLAAAYNNILLVSNRRACAAGRLFMETVLSLQDRDLRDALIMLSTP